MAKLARPTGQQGSLGQAFRSGRSRWRVQGVRGARLVVCQALPAADYSFYQRLRPGELNEQYLWELRLRPALDYLPTQEVRAVREALSLAYDAHAGQKRRSGEPFITHPVEVTRILAELQMDYESLVAGLLHDTVEDCGSKVKLAEIEFNFGPSVRRIVEGETKFSKLPRPPSAGASPDGPVAGPSDDEDEAGSDDADDAFYDDEDSSVSSRWRQLVAEASMGGGDGGEGGQQADVKAKDLQFLFLAMTEEVRIIVVKLADRLHNMRTMASMPPYKQRRIAQETLQVFAPLARLLGLYSIKEELEELSFKYALPEQYALMRRHVGKLWEAQQPVVEAARAELAARLAADPYLSSHVAGVHVEATRKALYSTWRKLQNTGKNARDVADIAQLRVVLEPAGGSDGTGGWGADAVAVMGPGGPTSDRQLCYHVMGLVHSFWAPIPGSMKDYMATPKLNNYQSLHTSVVPTGLEVPQRGRAPRGPAAATALFPIEVQIRTREMDRLAQFGIAVDSWSSADFSRQQAEGSVVMDSGNTLVWPPGSSTNGSRPLGASQQRQGSSSNGSSGAADWLPWGLGRLLAPSKRGARNGARPASSNGTGPYLSGACSNGSSASSSSEEEAGYYRTAFSTVAPSNSNGAAPAASERRHSSERLDPQVLSRRINWLNSIRAWQQEFLGTLSATEFVACVTDDLLGQGVFVFTPLGQVMRLPKGSTVVDFAYHIHTVVGNTMVAAKVNGKLVDAAHELQNAEVVEVIQYTGPVNAKIIQKHRRWLACAQTKTARHKIAKFLCEQVPAAVSKGLLPPSGASLLSAPSMPSLDQVEQSQPVSLRIQCEDRTGLLADVSQVISRYQHNIRSYRGSFDQEAALFVMEYELEGRNGMLQDMCSDLSAVAGVITWAARPSGAGASQRQQ